MAKPAQAIPPDECAKIVRLRKYGLAIDVIAKRLHRTEARIQEVLAQSGVQTSRAHCYQEGA